MNLPANWGKFPLKDLVISQKGKKPQWISEYPFQDCVPYLDIETLESGKSVKYADKYSTNISTTNDILIVADGSRSGLCFKGVDGAVGSTLLCLTPITINRDFLFYYLKSQYTLLSKNKTGDSIPHLSTDLFFNLIVPFPPINEQLEIVKLLESTWDRFENNFNAQKVSVNENLKRQLRDLEIDIPVSFNNDFSTKEFRQSILDYLLAANQAGNDIPFEENVSLESLVKDISYGTSKPLNVDSKGKPILRIPNIKDFFIDQSNLKYAQLSEDEYKKLSLKIGDILLIRSNGSINLLGKSCLVTKAEVGLGFAGYLLRLRVHKNKLLPAYLNYCFHSPAVRSQIESIERSSNGVNNINTKEVLALKINLPTLQNQRALIKKINLIFKKVEQIEIDDNSANESFKNLQESILLNAFTQSHSQLKKEIDLDGLAKEIASEKEAKEELIKNFKQDQLIKAKDIFMSSKDLSKIKDSIKRFTVESFEAKKKDLSEADLEKIKSYTIAAFKDFDFDDFSNIFLEMTQDKINKDDPDPFFKTKIVDGKIVIQIR